MFSLCPLRSFKNSVNDVDGLINCLIKNGYISQNGSVQSKFWNLKEPSQLVLDKTYQDAQNAIFTVLRKSILKLTEIHRRIKKSFEKPLNYRTLKRICSGESKANMNSLYQICMSLGVTIGGFQESEEKNSSHAQDSPVTYICAKEPKGTYAYDPDNPHKAYVEVLATSKIKNMSVEILTLMPNTNTTIEKTQNFESKSTHEKFILGLWGGLICIVDGVSNQ